jgi:AraC family transcriptional regulator, dual regulator of chb operon
MVILKWRDIAGSAAFHAARSSIVGPASFRHHGHDFAEVFWIDAGHGSHRINGTESPLQPGMLVFIRPSDAHGFVGRRGGELRQTNIAFPRATLAALRERYFPKKRWAFWQDDPLPAVWQVEPALLRSFNRWADELAAAPRETFYLERFLLNLLGELLREREVIVPDGTPDWLAQACRTIRLPEHFSGGVERFLALCGRSREHAARSVRQFLGTTPTAYVNRIRMTHVCRQLEMGDREILDLALDCGLGNLSHFYHLFREHTGTTPRAYRLAHRRPL